ncbi:MAG: DUF3486 family protein [Gammaproteobacteria bacterium]|uniref:DUF3486 family protein n=1 Tax=Nevskia sp. TaxID=1929292 RepID=UPI003F7173C8|nr:DUF3486 family protein [Gammaproteobacteria bacterium]
MSRKSSISTLDPAIRTELDRLLKDDRFTLEQIAAHLRQLGAQVSRSALGRYHKRFEESGKKIREAREVAAVWAERLGNEPQGDIGKVVMELLRTLAFDATMQLGEEGNAEVQISGKEIGALALAMQRLEAASSLSLKREQALRQAAAEEAASLVDAVAAEKPAGLTPEAAEEIKRRILGIKSGGGS